MAGSIFEHLNAAAPRFLGTCPAALVEWCEADPPTAVYSVACIACGSELFDLFEIRSCWRPDEALGIGVASLCCACGHSETLFDCTRDGYDGEHGHLKFLRPWGAPIEHAPLDACGVRIRVNLTYNSSIDELEKCASELGRMPRDFFDWFSVSCADPGATVWKEVWDYECA